MQPSDSEVIASSLEEPGHFGLIVDVYASHVNRYLAKRVGPGLAQDLTVAAAGISQQQLVSIVTSKLTSSTTGTQGTSTVPVASTTLPSVTTTVPAATTTVP